MKNHTILYLSTFLIFSLYGCYKDPVANFTMSSNSIEVEESVTFNNLSVDMERCEWLFGDGAQSEEINPAHVYQSPGNYLITLRVFSKNDMKVDVATDNIVVIQPTYLIIHVYDAEYEEPLDNALVLLYENEDDWFEDQNSIGEATTNSSGIVSFKDVPPGKIYISVFKEAYEEGGYTYFYCNWFYNLNGNTYNTIVTANKINEVNIYTLLAYLYTGQVDLAGIKKQFSESD